MSHYEDFIDYKNTEVIDGMFVKGNLRHPITAGEYLDRLGLTLITNSYLKEYGVIRMDPDEETFSSNIRCKLCSKEVLRNYVKNFQAIKDAPNGMLALDILRAH